MTITVGVGSTGEIVPHDQVRALAAALHKQVNRDLKPIWHVDAEVIYLENVKRPPKGVHPIIVTYPTRNNVAGQHYIEQGMSYAFVNARKNWRLAASHELLEMLVDPTGEQRKLSTGIAIVDGDLQDIDDDVEYVVEVCDPVEAPSLAYDIDGVSVSDFYTPHYFDRKATAGTRYSFRRHLTRPRQILPGGYVSWWHPKTKRLQQIKNIDGLEQVDLPPWHPKPGETARMFIDANTATPRSHPELFE